MPDMRQIIDLVEGRTPTSPSLDEGRSGLTPPEPFLQLINDYGQFLTFNTMELDRDGRDPAAQRELVDLVQTVMKPYLSGKRVWEIDPATLRRNRQAVMHHIHDMLNYMLPRLKKFLTDEGFERRKARINKLLTLYNNCASQSQ